MIGDVVYAVCAWVSQHPQSIIALVAGLFALSVGRMVAGR